MCCRSYQHRIYFFCSISFSYFCSRNTPAFNSPTLEFSLSLLASFIFSFSYVSFYSVF
jgi:hypothetical protein